MTILYIDLPLIHEVISPWTFTGLHPRGLNVCRPDKTVATVDSEVEHVLAAQSTKFQLKDE